MSKVSTIFEAVTACRDIFRRATKVSWLMQEEWAENKLADFNLWSASAGASTTGKASLDHRLRANPEALTILTNLLLMLKILIQKCIDRGLEIEDAEAEASSKGSTKTKDLIVKAKDRSAKITDPLVKMMDELFKVKVNDDFPKRRDESAKIKKDVEDSLNQLTRLTVAIRKAGNRSRLLKADSSFDPNSPQMRYLRRHLEILLLVHPSEDGSSHSSAQQLDPARLSPIQLRLIDANLRRRNRFLYAQKHAQKLGNNPEYSDNRPRRTPPLAKQSPLSDFGKTAFLSQEKKPFLKDELQAQSTTTATAVDEPIVIPPNQSTTSATTVVSVTSSRVSYPKPPPTRDGQLFFTCPCCCQSLPAAVGRGNRWKKHLMRDILPYTCIIDNCTMTDTFFMSKEAWLSHMNKEHECIEQWECHACSQKNIHATFRESDDFTAHLENQHSKGIRPQQVPMLRSTWRHKVPFKIPACPLCCFESDDQKVLLDHVAEHIHSFSLRSLPWAPREGLEDEDSEKVEEEGAYFKQRPYFDVNSCRTESSLISSRFSSLSIDLEAIAGSDSRDTSVSVHEKQQLTEEVLNQVPHDILGQTGTRGWLETLSNDPEGPHISPVVDRQTSTRASLEIMSDDPEGPHISPGVDRPSGMGQVKKYKPNLVRTGETPDLRDPVITASIREESGPNPPCISCVVERSYNQRNWCWYCCQCRDGPYSMWQTICQGCGHGSGSL